MADGATIASNVARLRLDRQLTQADLAAKARLSRVALGKIERGAVVPRARTLDALAKALAVSVGELVTPVWPLESVRFRARAQVHAREQILAEVSKWLDAYAWLETALDEYLPFQFEKVVSASHRDNPVKTAQAARRAVGLGAKEPVRDICGLLEENGVKLLLLETNRDSFFGLSVSSRDHGPAVVVNTWERISVERWIFTAAHELGHLLLHQNEYQRGATGLPTETEREADAFASEFLMPATVFAVEWDGTRGHSLLVRVLKVKRIFRVSYKTVLYRLVESGRETSDVWRAFQGQHRGYFGKTLRKTDEPEALEKSEFAWNWSRSGEPAGLSRHDFIEGRLSRLVRRALEEERISLGRAAEILGLNRDDMRTQAREWAG
jgi:Zn-dependent peptidase ImmA (M78 family)/transcriptional regulator with XRE-family HTH domain